MILCLITVLFFSVTIQAQYQGPCIPNPCKNGGVLVYDESRSQKIYCQCPSTHRGTVCQIPISNPCVPSPCHRGKCVTLSNSAVICRCDPGYRGRLCSIPNPSCNSPTCLISI